MKEKIVSTLVGLAGACGNNEKTPNTDVVVMKALMNCFSAVDEDSIVSEIRREKFTISPNCATCSFPCGNTSDYDMKKYHDNERLKEIKEEMLREAAALADRIYSTGKAELPDEIYSAITYFGYELAEDSYRDLINAMRQMELN